MSIELALILLFVVPIAIYILSLIIKTITRAILNNLKFDARNITIETKWVNKAFYEYAHYIVSADFNDRGMPIYTQKGQYRANYYNAVEKYVTTLFHECCNSYYLSEDFCEFINREYSIIRRKELAGAIGAFKEERENLLERSMDDFLNQTETITPEEFFNIKERQKGDIVGVYIIHNESKDMYYVGQAKRLFYRINQHFTGHGNGDVYADYKYGDDFSIKIIKLSESGYDDIDQLEKDMIKKYDAYVTGYNRTSGNN